MRDQLAEQAGVGNGGFMAAKQGIERLTARQVQTAKADMNDGGGLSIRVPRAGGGGPTWVYRFTAPDGRRRELGLGVVAQSSITAAGASLTAARKAAAKARDQLREGIDPIEHTKAQREQAKAEAEAKKAAAQAERHTLARVARSYHERVIEPSRTAKHAAQWISSLEQHVPAAIWHAPVDAVAAPALLDFFIDVCARLPETGSRIVQRLRAVFGDAEFRGWCAGNPADAAARKLREAKGRRERGHFNALPWQQVPQFMAELRQREGIAARALEFAVLTAARTGEVIGATWGEFDLDAGVWVIPGGRMKGGEAHTVYLSPRAVEIVKAAQEYGGESHVFPSPADLAAPLSNMSLLMLLRRLDKAKATTVHGLARASFSTWAAETGAARSEVVEACLAHREADRVKAAYSRAQFAAERRQLLAAWADYCEGREPASNVVDLGSRRAA
jgi:integrase